MDTGYQRDRKELYEKMMEEIGAHPDFGKRNPVDIGTECGYPEETVMEMIRFLQKMSNRQKTEPDQRQERQRYYFLIKDHDAPGIPSFFWGKENRKKENRKKEKGYFIVSVDISSWKTRRIKSVEEPVLFQIKENIYAWVDKECATCLKWEDLENGEHGEFCADSRIKDLLIVEDGIAAVTWDSFLLFRFHGEKTMVPFDITKSLMLMETQDLIYVISVYRENGINSSKIWKVTKKDFSIKKIFDEHKVGIAIVESTDEGLVWYATVPHHNICRRYSEGNLPYFDDVNEYLHASNGSGCGCTESINTRNYKLLQRKIIRRKDGKWVCNFDRAMPHGILGNEYVGQVAQMCEKDFYNGQVTGIYEKDIFIGVTNDDRIIRIDLRDDVTPDVVEITE